MPLSAGFRVALASLVLGCSVAATCAVFPSVPARVYELAAGKGASAQVSVQSAASPDNQVAAAQSGWVGAVTGWLGNIFSGLFGGNSTAGTPTPEVVSAPETPPVVASPPSATVATSSNYQPPVVIKTVRVVSAAPSGGISEQTLTDRLNALENKLRSVIAASTNTVAGHVSDTYSAVTLSNRIDQVENADILNSRFRGGSIKDASISASDLTVTGLLTAARAEILDLVSAKLTADNATFINSTTTNATTTNAYTANLTVDNLLATATSTLSGIQLSNADCSAFAGGGRLTTDASGNVICAPNSGGGGGPIGGSDTQIQFNDQGVAQGDSGLTYDKTTSLLSATNASIFNLTAGTLTAYGPASFGASAVSSFDTHGALTLAGVSDGPLQSISGLVSATSTIGVFYGGTGLSAAPTFGQLLVGNDMGGYTLTATSSLGLASALSRDWQIVAGSYLAPTSTLGMIVSASSTIGDGTQAGGLTINGGATTTGVLSVLGSATSTFVAGLRAGTLELGGFLDMGSGGSNRIVNLSDPINRQDAATKGYVDTLVASGISWQPAVIDFAPSAPGSPSDGDRYILSGTTGFGGSCHVNDIAQYDAGGAVWNCVTPLTGWSAYVINKAASYNFNGTEWVLLGSSVQHNSLLGLQGGNGSTEEYHLNLADYSALHNVNAQLTQLLTTGSPTFAGLTVSGAATTTGNAYFGGGVGIGVNRTTPGLSVASLANCIGGSALQADSSGNISCGTVSLSSLFTSATNFGVNTSATSSPLWAQAGLFASSSSAYPTLAVKQSGAGAAATFLGGNVGIGTSSPSSILSIGNVANFSAATSTFYSSGGLNLTGGCFSINGTCVTGGVPPFTSATNFGVNTSATTTPLWAQAGLFASSTSAYPTLAIKQGGAGPAATFLGGNVGIGTSSPNSILSIGNVANFTSATSTFYSTGGLNLTGGGCFSINGTCITGGGASLFTSAANFGVNTSATNTPLWAQAGLFASSTSQFSNANFYGNVGIGTSSPSSILSIGGVANFSAATSTFYSSGGLNLTGGCFSINGACVTGGGGSSLFTSATNFGVNTSATNTPLWAQAGLFASSTSAYPTLAIKQSGAGAAATFLGGNVGIGTSSPSQALSVTGTGYFTGGIQFGDGTVQTTAAQSLTLNGLNGLIQTFAVGTAGSDFSIVSAGTVHTFNIPTADTNVRGLVSTTTQAFAGLKTFIATTTLNGLDLNSTSIIGVAGPINPNDAANKAYVDSMAQGVSWQAPVIALATTTAPGSPTTGDRYILQTGATGFGSCALNDIVQWSGSVWNCITPSVGWTAYVIQSSANYNFNGTQWVSIGSVANHNSLSGLQGGNGSNEEYHLNLADYSNVHNVNAQLAQLLTTGSPTFANLTVSGAATTTGNAYFGGRVGIGTTTPGSLFSIGGIANFSAATSTLYGSGGLNLSGGCFAINGACLGGGITGTPGYAVTFDPSGKEVATSSLFFGSNGNISIGTSTSRAKLFVNGGIAADALNLSQSYDSTLSAVVGSSTGYTNFSGGIGTGGSNSIGGAFNNALRITSTGNLVNIGSIQAGETLLTKGGTLSPQTTYAVGQGPSGVSMGDFNGDGKPDLAVTNHGGSSISVLLNNGNGTFMPKATYSVGSGPIGIFTGDLNGDGRADIAVANQDSNTVSVLLSNGNGTFASQVTYVVGQGPRNIAIGDLNGDGKPDLVVTNQSVSSNSVSVLLNNGNGTFAPKVDYPVGTNPFGVSIGDLNGDGKADLVVTDYGSGSISVLLNNGNGTFASQVIYTAGTDPILVSIADFNGDGKPDLAVENFGSSYLSLFLNNGDGTFAPQVTYPVDLGDQGLSAADFNGDGRPDLAVTNWYGGSGTTTSILLNNGDGTFAPKVDYTVGSGPFNVSAGDLNGDGKPDLAVANYYDNTISILLNNATPMFYAQASTGNIGLGTSTPGSLLSVGNVANFTSATSTFYSTGGINLAAGCFSVGGLCISGSSGGSGAFPFTSTTNFGVNTSATTTPLWAQAGLFASSSSAYPTLAVQQSGAGAAATFLGGSVGIGTSSPSQALSVNGVGYFTGGIQFGDGTVQTTAGGGGGGGAFPFTSTINFGVNTSATTTPLWAQAGLFASSSSAYPTLAVKQSGAGPAATFVGGNVGIGATTTPYARLSVLSGSASNATLALAAAFGQTADILDVYAPSGALNSVLTSSGHLGLGTTSPWGLLSVNTNTVGAGAQFIVGSSTLTSFIVANNSNVGIGTSTPYAALSVVGQNSTFAGNNGALDAWQTAANTLPVLRLSATSVVANGYVYEVGGATAAGGADSAVYYAKLNSDGSVGAWITAANSLPAIRAGATSVVANGYVYVINGNLGGPSNDQSTVYYAKLNSDGSVGVWQTGTAVPAVRESATSVVANGYVYVMGGFTGSSAQSTVYYAKLNSDGSVGTWVTASNSLPAVRYLATSVVANGYVYVMGGKNSGGTIQSTVYYAKLNSDGSVGTWTTAANALPALRYSATSVVANGYVYEIGGDGGSTVATVYSAKLNSDGSVGTWRAVAAVPDVRESATSVVANGYVYVLGGSNGTAQNTVFYASFPRTSFATNLDLLGLTGGTVGDSNSSGSLGSVGGSIFAGDIFSNGALNVTGNANFSNGIGVNGALTLSALTLQEQTNSIFSISNATGTAPILTALYNGKIGMGTTTPWAQLSLNPNGSLDPEFAVGSPTRADFLVTNNGTVGIGTTTLGSALFKVGSNLPPTYVPGTGAVTWTSRTGPGSIYNWSSVTYGNGIFLATGGPSSGENNNDVITSPDGVNWTLRTSGSLAGSGWGAGVIYADNLFVAISGSSTIASSVMTSPDGINWTFRATGIPNSHWYNITYGNGLFVAVGANGTGPVTGRVMTSPDGINWTSRTAAVDTYWSSVTYGNGLFVAVAASNAGDVMTSPDGVTWTSRTTAAAYSWESIAYGNGLFVAVSNDNTSGGHVMTSPDGINWTLRTCPNATWWDITYGNGLFVAVARFGNGLGGFGRVMTSPDGINWTFQSSALALQWESITYAAGRFVVVGDGQGQTANNIMTSNLDQVSNPGDLFNVDSSGNVGIASSTPASLLSINGAANFYTSATSTIYNGLSTPYLSLTGTTSTSTAANGFNLTGGCFSVNGICISSGSAFPFTPLTNFGVTASATTTPLWAQAGLFASSSSAYPTLAIKQSGAGAAATFLGGNVGIGTSTPSQALSVNGIGYFTGGIQFGDGTVQTTAGGGGSTFPFTPSTNFGVNTSATTTSLWARAGLFASSTTAYPTLSVQQSGAGAAAVFLGGNVGIGTTTPGSLFSVNGIANFTAATSTFYSTGGLNLTGGGCFSVNGSCISGGSAFPFTPLTNFGVTASATTTPLWAQNGLFASSTSQFVNANFSGNVGIGTTTSVYTLTVASSVGAPGVWQTAGNALPGGRYYASAVMTNDYVYEIGGNNGSSDLSAVVYAKLNSDGSVGAWATGTPLPALRRRTTSVAVNGYLYVLGGFGANSVYYSKLNNDGSLGAWTTSANSLPLQIYDATSIVANGYVYLIGGTDGTVRSSIYYASLNSDGSIGAWQTASSVLPSGGRYAATSVVANGYVYEIGGVSGGSTTGTVYYAKLNSDGTVGSWISTTALPSARDTATSVVANGYVYVLGGNGIGYQSTVYYAKLNSDGSLGTWATAANALPGARYGATSIMSIGYIYEIGGYDASVYQATVLYSSLPRTLMSTNLDLIGMSSSTVGDWGSSASQSSVGGSIFAGDIFSNGALNVMGNANLSGSLGVSGNFSLTASTSATTTYSVFTISNATGTSPILSALYNGNVGIGTSSPSQALSVNGIGYFTGGIQFGDGTVQTTAGGSGSAFPFTPLTNFGVTASATTTPLWAQAGLFASSSSAYPTLAIKQSGAGAAATFLGGNVGIGTSTPGSIFSVNGVANFTSATSTFYSTGGINLTGGGCFSVNGVCVTSGGGSGAFPFTTLTNFGVTTSATTTALWAQAGIFASSSSAYPTLSIQQSGAGAAAIFLGGNVGIGTTTPGSLFSVNGSANFFAAATSTIYSGLSTPYLSLTGTTASSTAANGINLTAGCFAISGTCLSAGGGITGTQGYSITFNAGGAQVATSSLFFANNGNIGVGTTTPSYDFTVAGQAAFAGDAGAPSSWNTATPLPAVRSYAGSVTANGYLYEIGGTTNGVAAVNTVYYAKLNSDGSTGTWTTAATVLPGPVGNTAAVAANGYVYLVGGYSGGALKTIYYAKLNSDGSVGTWAAANPLPAARQNAAVTVANGYVYAVGGSDGSTIQSTVYYAKLNSDGSVGVWQTGNSTGLAARYEATSVVANGYIYFIGGYNAGAFANVYYSKLNSDGSVGPWSAANSLTAARYSATSVVANGYLYEIGGNPANTVYYAKLNSDGSLGAWATAANALPAARAGTNSVVANGYVYAVGGYDGSSYLTTVLYASFQRTSFATNLDLIGFASSTMGDVGSSGSVGGSIFAGDIFSNGALNVTGNSNLSGGLGVFGSFSLNASSSMANASTSPVGTSPSIFTLSNATGTSPILSALYNGNVGIGTSTPQATLTVAGSLCVATLTGGSGCSTATAMGDIYYHNSHAAGSYDVAEMYRTNDETLSAGDIVAMDTDNPLFVKKATRTSPALLGVVSTQAGMTLGDFDAPATDGTSGTSVPVALGGRIPVKVSLENGPIAIGDRIALSSRPGVGKEAGPLDASVGIALENYDGTGSGSIEVFATLDPGIDGNAIEKAVFGGSITKDRSSGTLGIGFGTNGVSPSFLGDTLAVNGTVGANSFVVRNDTVSGLVATSSITALSTNEEDTALALLASTTVSMYAFANDASSTLHLGVLAADAPASVRAGAGVDMYALQSLAVAAIKAQQREIVGTQMRLAALEVQQGTTSSSSSEASSSPVTFVLNALASLGVTISNGVWNFAQMAVDSLLVQHLTAVNLNVQNLLVGSTSMPSGITLFDALTRQPFCLMLFGGTPTTSPGPCNSSMFASSTPSATSSTTPELSVQGNNPATINMGDVYNDLGATITGPQEDLNLGINAIVDGGATTTLDRVVIDTLVVGSHTITYVAVDQNGLIGSTTRTVNVIDPNAASSTDASSTPQ